jgi:hypothetical protein
MSVSRAVLFELLKENELQEHGPRGLQRKGVSLVIAILIPHRKPPMVFETTREEIVVMATDASATSTHTSSIPPGLLGGEFDTAWAVLTKDLHSAQHFENVDEALTHYKALKDGLTLPQHALVMTALQRIAEGGSPRRPTISHESI